MVPARYTHVTIQADDSAESVRFYEPAYGLERFPTTDFAEPIQWLRCGDVQLHLIETDARPLSINRDGLHVDDFEAVYRVFDEEDGAEFEALPHVDAGFVDGAPPVYVLPTGEVQLYVRHHAEEPRRGERPGRRRDGRVRRDEPRRALGGHAAGAGASAAGARRGRAAVGDRSSARSLRRAEGRSSRPVGLKLQGHRAPRVDHGSLSPLRERHYGLGGAT